MIAKRDSTCPICQQPIAKGAEIAKRDGAWAHAGCQPRPAPMPELIDRMSLTPEALRRWQDGRRAARQLAYEGGPTVYVFETSEGGINCYVSFPTFGKDERQTRLLRQAGFEWDKGWRKPTTPDRAEAEVEAARAIYRQLHPGWQARPGDDGIARFGRPF